MHQDDRTSRYLPRRRFLRSAGALLAAGAGLAGLPVNAGELQQTGTPTTPPEPTPPPAGLFPTSPPWSPSAQPAASPTTAPPTPVVTPTTAPPTPVAAPTTAPPSTPTPDAVAVGEELPAWVKPREAWGAVGPVQPYVPHAPTTVSLHHTGAVWSGRPSAEQYLRNIQAFHIGREREWEDIAYHFLVDLEGGVWAGRPPTVRGNSSVYYNSMGYVLICFLGDYGPQQPSELQLTAAASTAAWLVRRFNLAPDALDGHRDHAPTSCPGDNLYRLLKDGSFAGRVQSFLA